MNFYLISNDFYQDCCDCESVHNSKVLINGTSSYLYIKLVQISTKHLLYRKQNTFDFYVTKNTHTCIILGTISNDLICNLLPMHCSVRTDKMTLITVTRFSWWPDRNLLITFGQCRADGHIYKWWVSFQIRSCSISRMIDGALDIT